MNMDMNMNMKSIIDKFDNKLLAIILFIIFIFFVFFLPFFDNMKEHEQQIFNENFDNMIVNQIDKKFCSKQCCKHVQWPVTFNTKNPKLSDTLLDDFIGTNFTCNGGDGGGCVCIKKEDYEYLSNHGQDGELYDENDDNQSSLESNNQSSLESNNQSSLESNNQSSLESNNQSNLENNNQSNLENNNQSNLESNN
jgi:hypothetical protein